MTKYPTSRTMVKRDLSQAVIHIERTEHYLVRSGHLYEPDHPEVYKMFCVLVTLADQLKTGLQSLREHL